MKNRLIIYTSIIIFLPILFLSGLFWDDWILYDSSSEFIISLMSQAGYILRGYMHAALLSTKFSFLYYRIVDSSFFLLSVFITYKILKYFIKDKNIFILFILLLYIIIPLNSAKFALINAISWPFIFFFYMAFYMLIRYMNTRNLFYRIGSLLLFLLSFRLDSLLVYYLIIAFYLLWEVHHKITSIKTFLLQMLFYADFLLLPMIGWVVRSIFFASYGEYTYYHNMKEDKILAAFGKTFDGIILIFQQLAQKIIALPISLLLIILSLSFFMTCFYKKRTILTLKKKEGLLYILGGFCLIYLSLFPYVAVGVTIDFKDWGSRTQIIAILGFTLVIATVIFTFSYTKIKIFLMSSIILTFTILNLQSTYQYQRDWYKQLSIIENFKSNNIIKAHTSFLVIDKIKKWNVNNRRIRFYEYAGMFKEAFGDEKRFALPIDSYRVKYYKKRKLNPFFRSKFKLSEYTYKETEYYIVINKVKSLTIGDVLKLKYKEIFDYPKFLDNVKKYINLKTIIYTQTS